MPERSRTTTPNGPFFGSSVGAIHRLEIVLVALAACAYAVLIHQRSSPYVGGSDSSAYYNNAKLFSAGKISADLRIVPGLPVGSKPVESAHLYLPLGFRALGSDRMVVTYPIGLSLLMSATAFFTGWESGAGWTAGWHMFAGVLLMYALGRECGLSVGWARFGAAILATAPLYTAMGLQPLSDAPALVWCAAAIYLALLSRRHRGWAFAAGFAIGMAVLVRPTNCLVLAPVLVCIGADLRRTVALVVGGAPAAIVLCLYNLNAYGAILTTGYGDLSEAFSLQFALPTLAHYLRWLPLLINPLILVAALLPWQNELPRRTTALLVTGSAVVLVFYAFYYFTHIVWWNLRFVLPAVPTTLIAALVVLQTMIRKRINEKISNEAGHWCPRGIATAAVVLTLGFNVFWIRKLHTLEGKRADSVYLKVCDWLNANVPANSVIAASHVSGALFCYTPFRILRWEMITPATLEPIESRLQEIGYPLYAAIFPDEEKRVLTENMPGPWVKQANVNGIGIWRRGEAASP